MTKKITPKPPKIAEWLVERLAFCREKNSFVGDLHEVFNEICSEKGRFKALLWYWNQVFISVVPFFLNLTLWSYIMFKNYLKIAFRNLKKYKVYTFINIFGLAAGITAVLLILAFIQEELSYDKFHENIDNIYRISVIKKKEGKYESDHHVYTAPIGEAMKKDFPEVADFTRMTNPHRTYVEIGNNTFKMSGIRYVEPSFFDIFSFKLLTKPENILTAPFTVVLTEKTAERLFGHKNPVGETIKIEDDTLTVCAVAEDPPENSHIQFNMLISFSSLHENPEHFLDWNGGHRYITYVTLHPRATAAQVERKFPEFMWRNINELYKQYGSEHIPYLQPLKDIHLNYTSPSIRTNIYVFSAIALFILLLACINFINLSTARAAKRAKEVGLRKVLGAERGALIRQFLFEAVFLSFFAFIIGFILVDLLAPFYRYLLNRDLRFLENIGIDQVLILLALIAVVGFAAGFYPAFYMSSFKAARTLKGVSETRQGKQRFRNVLVVLQFSISITLIICTMVINRQIDFMKNMELGFDKENIVTIPLENDVVMKKTKILQTELNRLPGVLGTTASSDVPYHGFTRNGYVPEGFKHSMMIHVIDVDTHFLKTFDIDIVDGRKFSNEISSDKDAYLINRTLAKLLNWENPVGKTIKRGGVHPVIGVVEDFKYDTMRSSVKPLIITNRPSWGKFDYLSVKIAGENVSRTMAAIEAAWEKIFLTLPFDFFFLDEAVDRLYKAEERFREIFLGFSILAIAIALLGLFSLASFTIQQRSKEIGIRKVLGASKGSIFMNFSKQFLVLIFVSNLIAQPAAYYLADKWLRNFAFRESLPLWLFVFTLVGSLLTALLTISYQVIKASNKNPVEELKYE